MVRFQIQKVNKYSLFLPNIEYVRSNKCIPINLNVNYPTVVLRVFLNNVLLEI